ncbi:MAG: FecR family protein [Melioribacteraceae bacterium]|nr:MAG: FecR family protein [Melioribacteraceae bacterium]
MGICKMNNEQIYSMLAKYFSGESSPDEINKVNDWLNENSGNRVFYEDVKAVWENSLPANNSFNVEDAWEKVKTKSFSSDTKEKKYFREKSALTFQAFNYLKIAAGIVIMLGFTYLYFNLNYKVEPFENTVGIKQIISDKGEIRKIRLDDGTVVTLNSESELRIPEDFFLKERNVSLTGEAYFEVAHDSKKPFIVSTEMATIKVIGTKFNVTAWQENDEVTVAVSEGKVFFGSESGGDAVFINQGEISTAFKDTPPIVPVKVDVQKYYLSWLSDELNFYNASFKNIIHRLENKYGINISVNDASILTKQLTANFKDESLEEILYTISLALDLKFSEEKNSITFSYDNR